MVLSWYPLFTSTRPLVENGGGGGEKRNFNFRELLEKFGVKGITCCHGNPVSDAMFSKVLTF